MSEPCTVACPYCQHLVIESFEEGYGVRVCSDCMQPFLVRNRWIPDSAVLKVEGCIAVQRLPTPEEIEEDAKYYDEHPEELDEITESMKQPLTDEIINDVRKWANVLKCVECGKPVSPDSDWRLCEDCLKDDEHEKPISTNSVFLKCPNAPNSFYRLDGDYVEVKYKKGSVVRTTWSDIHAICEEENPTPTIKELLGERANTNNVAAMNAFVRAVKVGLIEVDV